MSLSSTSKKYLQNIKNEEVISAMSQLKGLLGGKAVYYGGSPKYERNFSRDGFIAGILMENSELLRSQLLFSAEHQGQKKDSQSGEEFGKIHHEIPQVIMNGLSTKYSACDVTALFLIAHEIYQGLNGDNSLVEMHKEQIGRAVKYIRSHLNEDMFFETPELSGGERFALKVTYWKDSVLLDREEGNPSYPIMYPLAHAINIAGLRSAAKLINSSELEEIAGRMVRKLITVFDEGYGTFYIATDSMGSISAVSSDSLHMLSYLEPEDIPRKLLEKIVEASKVLETPLGYRTLEPEATKRMHDKYHARTVWPFEQAIIHKGAKKFGLERPLEVTERILGWITDSNPELFKIGDDSQFNCGGCDPQLWTIAAKSYFKSQA